MASNKLTRRAFATAIAGALCSSSVRGQSQRRPNVILILADDLGFGDLGCYGSSIPTPNLDRMASEGVRLTRFYSASPVCSPSRAALLAGKYPARTGIVNVLMPDSTLGLSATERTIPRVLKEAGYRTGCVGKWHLGTLSQCTPTRQGFDEFYGIPYSNDMWPLPVLRGTQVVEDAPALTGLTNRFTAQAVDFIERNADAPFFLYLAHTAPHIPLAASERFRGKSGRGAYGDVVAELDWGVGEVLGALQRKGLDENTLVIFTSDNGPWYQGSPGNLQGRKGSTFEGGVREPFIARFPGRIPAGLANYGLTSMMDLLPTIAGLCGGVVGAPVDGVDIWPLLSGEREALGRDALLFFDGYDIQCIRWGPWKLHVARFNSFAWTLDPPGGRKNLPLAQPELYNVDDDPTESYDRAPEMPEVVADMKARLEKMLHTMPEQVRVQWRDTQARRVEATPVGALPRDEN